MVMDWSCGTQACRSWWLRAMMVWTFWLLPLDWCSLYAADGDAQVAPWQRGISTWNGDAYAPSAEQPATELESAFDEPEPYTVPVDPKLYTEPLASVPYPEHADAKMGPATVNTSMLRAPDGEYPLPPTQPDDVDEASVNAEFAGFTQVPSSDLPKLDPPATISEQIETGIAVEEPPLQQDTVRWYHYPWRWMTQGWKNHAEFGLNGSAGNAETLALQTGVELKRTTDAYTLAVDIDYRYANAGDITTENNGRYNIDYDQMFPDSPWSAFGKYGLEWDQFKAFDLRVNLNGGVGYHWLRNDQTTFVTRFGAGASREINAPVDRWVAEAVFGLDGEHQLNSRNKLKGKVDYFPAWADFGDFRLVSDAAWEILLDDTENLSLKLGVTDRYDSTPQGARPNDFYYSALLLVKF